MAEQAVASVVSSLNALQANGKDLHIPPHGHDAYMAVGRRFLCRVHMNPSVVEVDGGDTDKAAMSAKEVAGSAHSRVLLVAGVREELNREIFPGRDTWTTAEVERVRVILENQLTGIGALWAPFDLEQLLDLPAAMQARIVRYCDGVASAAAVQPSQL